LCNIKTAHAIFVISCVSNTAALFANISPQIRLTIKLSRLFCRLLSHRSWHLHSGNATKKTSRWAS
jgi:hypothetical protein